MIAGNYRGRCALSISLVPNTRGPSYQSCGIFPKTKKGHVNFEQQYFEALKYSKFQQFWCISRQLLITSTYIYTFWKRENKPDKSPRSHEPPKNDNSFLFSCVKYVHFLFTGNFILKCPFSVIFWLFWHILREIYIEKHAF